MNDLGKENLKSGMTIRMKYGWNVLIVWVEDID